MNKEIYIHVGAGKTGTTAIQSFLLLNKDLLNRNGVCIPVIGALINKKTLVHHALAGGAEFNDSISLWEELLKLNKSKLVVSSEFFHSHLMKPGGKKFFTTIKNLFEEYEITIVYYIRRQDLWNESAYEQWIKSGNKRDGSTLKEFLSYFKGDQPQEVLEFSKIFGKENMVVRPYENSQFYRGDIFFDFLYSINCHRLEENWLIPAGNSNPRLSTGALEYKRIHNTVCSSKNDAQLLLPLLQKYSALISGKGNAPYRKTTLMNSNDREWINNNFKKKYELIAREFLDRESGDLFYEEVDLPVEEQSIDLEEVVKITSFILLDQEKRIKKLESIRCPK